MADTPGLFAFLGGIGTVTDTDNFNRANQDPLAGNWTSSGTPFSPYNLVSNTAQPKAGGFGFDCYAFWNIWSHGDDQYSQAEITVVGTTAQTGFGVCVRQGASNSSNTGYRAVIASDGTIDFLKFVSDVTSLHTTRSVTYIAGTKLALSATGSNPTTLKIWYGGIQQGAAITDSSSPITTGKPGIAYSSASTSGSQDNWDAGTVP